MTFFQRLQQETAQSQQLIMQAPIIQQCAEGNITKDAYIKFLTQAYHHVKHTVPLLMACGGKLSQDHEWVRQALAEYIEEEYGHQEWILNDITACGGDTQLVRENTGIGKVGTSIDLMISYLYHQIDRCNPMGLFGMVWVLEGSSVGIGAEVARQVKETLQLPEDAMSYLVSHSVLDQDHIQFFEQLMNQITKPEDQQAIIDSANMVFRLYAGMLNELTQ
ncbi:iron-containing redox enzyme family protein [Vibrio sp.]|nr:iron-containing redox enzyme family protein [Vibrio sp.]